MAESKKVETPDELPNMGEEEAKGEQEITPQPEAGSQEEEVNSLIAELEKAGVTNTEQLQNKLAVTKEYGKVVNMLGDLKAENKDLKKMLESSRYQTNDYDSSDSTDLGDLINKVLDSREQKKMQQQQQVTQNVMKMWNDIQDDQDYGLVKDIWEAKLKDPNYVFKIQQGMTNPVQDYNQTVREYYKGIAKRSVDTIKTLQGGGKVKPPYVESGAARVPGVKSDSDESPQTAKLKALQERVDKGESLTEDEQAEALMASLMK